MRVIYTTGTWRPSAGAAAAFVEAWAAFAGWASTMPGAGTLVLVRDRGDVGRFVSFGRWQSDEAVRAWKGHAEFSERMASVLRHVDDFQPAELELIAIAEAGSTETEAPASVR